MVVVKIKRRTYELLQKHAEGGQFKSQSYTKDGFYYIEVDPKVYKRLLEIDHDDIDKAIFQSVVNYSLSKNS